MDVAGGGNGAHRIAPMRRSAQHERDPAALPVRAWVTSRAGARLDPGMNMEPLPEGATASGARIRIDPSQCRQTLLGFGGAFTEAAAVALERLPAAVRAEALRAYFGPGGAGYTLCRTHINSCDFALGNYAYSETPADHMLAHFSIERDRQRLIPLIRDALQLATRPVRLLASPWSPPAWMKTNGQMNRGGCLRPECRDTWARYLARYLQAYASEGFPLWGITVQNEPEAAQKWDSCLYTGAQERDFIRDHLGPTLAREGLGDVRILAWDHNKDALERRAADVFADPGAARYTWGLGFHWYTGDHFEALDAVHARFPQAHLVFTEGCQEGGVKLGSWELGERYGHAIIGDLNHWTEGWIDWNMVLDRQGGPNHVGNYCDAPIIADAEGGTLHYQSAYFYLCHFSRFLPPGSVWVESRVEDCTLECVAARHPDGSLVAVVMNRGEREQPVRLECRGAAYPTRLPAHAIATFVWEHA